jgi:hypothetical protein
MAYNSSSKKERDRNNFLDKDVNYISVKESLNPTEPAFTHTDRDKESNNDPQSLGYCGRLARQVTVNARPRSPIDNKFYKVIIPYNFDKKKYIINKKEIEFYENKKYLTEKLRQFNLNEKFDIEKDYIPSNKQKFCLYVPTILLSIIALYISIVTSAFMSFNIVVMFTIGTWLRKGYNSLQMFKFILLEKFKIKAIHSLLDQENNTEFCVEKKLRWILGQSGYWIEVQKLIE